MSEKAMGLVGNLEQAALDQHRERRVVASEALRTYIAGLEATIAAGARSAARELGTPDESSAEGRDYWRMVTNRLDRIEAKVKATDRAVETMSGLVRDVNVRSGQLLDWARTKPSWMARFDRKGL